MGSTLGYKMTTRSRMSDHLASYLLLLVCSALMTLSWHSALTAFTSAVHWALSAWSSFPSWRTLAACSASVA